MKEKACGESCRLLCVAYPISLLKRPRSVSQTCERLCLRRLFMEKEQRVHLEREQKVTLKIL